MTDDGDDWYISSLYKVTLYLSSDESAQKAKRVNAIGKIDHTPQEAT